MININWHTIPFLSLTAPLLYDIMALREEVFTLEQKCTERDLDGLDKYAIHVVGAVDNRVIATGRILPPNIYKAGKVSFGRLAIQQRFRRKGYGDELLTIIIKYIGDNYDNIPIEFSSQLYLKHFYEKYGFIACGEIYSEGGIPHIMMRNNNKQQR